jgi:hypothetical protein
MELDDDLLGNNANSNSQLDYDNLLNSNAGSNSQPNQHDLLNSQSNHNNSLNENAGSNSPPNHNDLRENNSLTGGVEGNIVPTKILGHEGIRGGQYIVQYGDDKNQSIVATSNPPLDLQHAYGKGALVNICKEDNRILDALHK